MMGGVALIGAQIAGNTDKASKRGSAISGSQNIEARLRAALGNRDAWDLTKYDDTANASLNACIKAANDKVTGTSDTGCALNTGGPVVIKDIDGNPISQSDPDGRMTDALQPCAANSTDPTCRWRVISTWTNQDSTGRNPRIMVKTTLSYVPALKTQDDGKVTVGPKDMAFKDREFLAFANNSGSGDDSSGSAAGLCASLGGDYDANNSPQCKLPTADVDPRQVCDLLGQSYDDATSKCSGATVAPAAVDPEITVAAFFYLTPNIWTNGKCDLPAKGKKTRASTSYGDEAAQAATKAKNWDPTTVSWYKTAVKQDAARYDAIVLPAGTPIEQARKIRDAILARPANAPLNAGGSAICPAWVGDLQGFGVAMQVNRDPAESRDNVSRCVFKVKKSKYDLVLEKLRLIRQVAADANAKMVASTNDCPAS